MTTLSWPNVWDAAEALYCRRRDQLLRAGMWGVPCGGWWAVFAVERFCLIEGVKAPAIVGHWSWDGPWPVVLDDVVDSGRTLGRYADKGAQVDALFRKQNSPTGLADRAPLIGDGWVRFPWESDDPNKSPVEDNVVRLLEWLGEDPGREGLRETPGRVCRALAEMTAGQNENPKQILAKRFKEENDQMVVLRGIRFTSVCEHHLLPFSGTATVGYLPTWQGVAGTSEDGEEFEQHGAYEIVGVSKLARLVECYARRLQNQERLANQVAQALTDELGPKGVGVLLTAIHGCMACRGVRQPSAEMVTSALRGVILTDPNARAEFLALAGARS